MEGHYRIGIRFFADRLPGFDIGDITGMGRPAPLLEIMAPFRVIGLLGKTSVEADAGCHAFQRGSQSGVAEFISGVPGAVAEVFNIRND